MEVTAVHGQLETKTWDVRIWILGMLLMLDPCLVHSPYVLHYILLNYWIIPENPPNIYKISYIRVRGFPERDILSLRTLGLGLDRFGEFFRRRRTKVGNPRI